MMFYIELGEVSSDRGIVEFWTSELKNVEVLNGVPGEAKRYNVYLDKWDTGYVVESIPEEPSPQKYKNTVLYYNTKTSEIWWEYVDRELTYEEKMDLLLQKEKTAGHRYRDLQPATTPPSLLKQAKIDQLNEACEAAILRGFTSATTGYFYAFDTQDQTNFTQQMLLLIADPSAEAVAWKTEDAGVIVHSREQFLAICAEAEQHKRAHIARYWQLKADVVAATTWQEVDAIIWS